MRLKRVRLIFKVIKPHKNSPATGYCDRNGADNLSKKDAMAAREKLVNGPAKATHIMSLTGFRK